MGDSLKDFLARRKVELDDVPSVKHPEGTSYRFTAPPWKKVLALKALLVYGVQTAAQRVAALASVADIEDPAERDRVLAEIAQTNAAANQVQFARIVADLVGDDVDDPANLDDREEERMYRVVMGATYDEMIADGVDGDAMEAVFQLLIRKYGGSQDIAAQIAPPDALGESPAQPNRQTRRAAGRKAGSKSSPASGAPSVQTRKRAAAGSSAASKTPAKPRAKKTA